MMTQPQRTPVSSVSEKDLIYAHLAGIRRNVKQAKMGDLEALDMITLKVDWIWDKLKTRTGKSS